MYQGGVLEDRRMTIAACLPLPSLSWLVGPPDITGVRLRDPYHAWSVDMLGYTPELTWNEDNAKYDIVFRSNDDATLFHIAFPG
jgi:hypothetical protein